MTETQTYTPSRVKPASKVDNVKLIYRGITLGNPGYDAALIGKSYPIGGHSSPLMHRDGQTNSNFTSWTTDILVAYKFATNGLYGRCTGVILIKKIDVSDARFVETQKLVGGDIYDEKEILVKGMMNGAIPVLVNPDLTKEAILKLIKL
jgi:hypothetical protein